MGSTQSSQSAQSSLNTELTMSFILSARPHTQIQLWLNGEQYSADSSDLKNALILHPSAQILEIIPHLKLNNPILQKTIQISLPEHLLDQLLFSDEGTILNKTLPSEQLLSSRSSRMLLSARGAHNTSTHRAGVLNEITSSQYSKQNSISNKLQYPLIPEKYSEYGSIQMNDSQFSMFSMKSPKQLFTYNQFHSALNGNSNNAQQSQMIPSTQSQILNNPNFETSNTINSQRSTQPSSSILRNQPSKLVGTAIPTRQSISIQEKLKTLGTIPSYTYVTMNPDSEISHNSSQLKNNKTTSKIAISLPKKEAYTLDQKDFIQAETSPLSQPASPFNRTIRDKENQVTSMYPQTYKFQDVSAIPNYLTSHYTHPQSKNTNELLNKCSQPRNKTEALKLNVSALHDFNNSHNFTKVRSHSTISNPPAYHLPSATSTTGYYQVSQNLGMDEAANSNCSATQKSLCRNKSCIISPQQLLLPPQVAYQSKQSILNSSKQPYQISEDLTASLLSSMRYQLPSTAYDNETDTLENQQNTSSLFFKALQDNQTSSQLIRRRR